MHHWQETNPDTGELEWVAYEVLEPVSYRYQTCVVTLENFNLSHLPFCVLSRESIGRYAIYHMLRPYEKQENTMFSKPT